MYSSEEIELALFYAAAEGHKTIGGEEGLLYSLRHPAKAQDLDLLGFTAARQLPARVAGTRGYADGVPSSARFSGHNSRMSLHETWEAWRQIYFAHRDIEFSMMSDEEFLTLVLDASNLNTIFMPPVYDKKTKLIVNPTAVKCIDGGMLPKGSHDPYAKGYKTLMLWTSTGTSIGQHCARNTVHESTLAVPLLDGIAPVLKPRIERLQPRVAVISGDSAFATDPIRRSIRAIGCVENTSRTSAQSDAEARKQDDVRIYFRHRPAWYTNGHAEPNCICGTAKLTRTFTTNERTGILAPTVCARCPVHGELNITSGQYVVTENPRQWVKHDALMADHDGKPEKFSSDLRLGNGLTFNDWLAHEYAQKRWGHNEGIHGALSNSGLLFNGDNRFRSLVECEIAVFKLLTALHLRGIRFRTMRAAATLLAA